MKKLFTIASLVLATLGAAAQTASTEMAQAEVRKVDLDAKKITLPHLAKPDPADDREGLAIVAAALVRGQGKTEGLHRRTIRTPGALRDADGRRLPLDRIGEVAGCARGWAELRVHCIICHGRFSFII